MPAHPLTNFETQEYYKIEPRFNGVYSRDNLPKTIKNGVYVINIYVINYLFRFFWCRTYIPKEIKIFIGHKNI